MMKGLIFFCINVCILLIVFTLVNAAGISKLLIKQENHAPVVKITAPKNNASYQSNTVANYSINVSDAEDGDSKFDEISSNEVFLNIKYLPDTTNMAAELRKAEEDDPPGIAAIRASNCLNCHAFNGKLIGPSFYDINKRYPKTAANIEQLKKHIKDGSTGVWGNVAMPTHPELSQQNITTIVDWILKNGAASGVYYYRGTEGSFKIDAPVKPEGKGALILTASYTDHGLKDQPKQKLRGHDVITLVLK